MKLPLIFFAAAFFLLPASAFSKSEILQIDMNSSLLYRIAEQPASLIISDPSIMGVNTELENMLIISARAYGASDMIGLDERGAVLFSTTINVVEAGGAQVNYWAGDKQQSYHCTPNCVPMIDAADGQENFTKNISQQGAIRQISRQQRR